MNYSLYVLISFFISLVCTSLVRLIAIRNGHFDDPANESRKVHKYPVPRIGGIAIFIALITTLFLVDIEISSQFGALMLAATGLFLLGVVDDIKGVRARTKLFFQIIFAGVVLAGGTGIVDMNVPFLGHLRFDQWIIPLEVFEYEFNVIPIANAITIGWIVAIVNAINLIDGLDGLAGGVSVIGFGALALMGVLIGGVQAVVVIAIILIGATLGFLAHNMSPAKIFLGDSGAYTLGLFLAVLPIYSGTKLAVGTLVISVAVIDMFWAIARRIITKRPIFSPDRGHIHHQLIDTGLRQGYVVGAMYIFTLAIAVATVMSGLFAAVSVLVGIFCVIFLWIRYNKYKLSSKQ